MKGRPDNQQRDGSLGDTVQPGEDYPDLSVRSPAEVTEAMAMLGPFVEIGYALIPLRIGAKTPTHTGWQSRDYAQFDFEHWLTTGGNIGCRLAATDLVIDIDPRNFTDGDDPLARLSEVVGADLSDMPATITGSGGRHLFCRKPAEVRVVGRLAGYEGIDFKSIGGLVFKPMTAGCAFARSAAQF